METLKKQAYPMPSLIRTVLVVPEFLSLDDSPLEPIIVSLVLL